MDPQQRLLLETAWEALERAGIDPAHAARQPDRGVRRRDAQDYGPRLHEAADGLRGLPADRQHRQRRLGPHRLHPRPRGPGGHGRHRVLVVAGRAAPGRAGAAARASATLALAGGVTVMATPGHVRRVQPAARAGRRTAGARRSPPPPTAPAGPRASGMLLLERLSDARRNGHPVLAVVRGSRGQPGRRQQRPHRAQRPVPAARDPPGAGRRRARPRPRSTRSRRTAPAPRSATRSRRRRCWPPTARTATDRPLLARLAQVQHRPHPGRRRRRRASSRWSWRCGTASCPRTLHVDEPTPHVDWPPGDVRLAHRGPALARDRPPAPRRRLLLRHQRHQRPRHPRAGPGTDARAGRRRTSRRRGARAPWAAVRQDPSRRCGPRPGRLRGHLADHAGLTPADVGRSLATTPRRTSSTGPSVVAADRDGARSGPGRAHRAASRRPPWSRGTARPPARSPSCSPARAASASAWAGSCTRPSRSSRAPSTRCAPRSTAPGLPLREVMCGRRGGAAPDRVHPARAVRRRGGAVPAAGVLGRTARTSSPATRSASWPPPTSPGCSSLADAARWSPRAAG